MKGFDPVYQLVAKEAVRFIGTVGDIMTNVCATMYSVVQRFHGSEIRARDDLMEAVRLTSAEVSGSTVKQTVVSNTIDVAASLDLISPIAHAGGRGRKYTLGAAGRVILAVGQQPNFDRSSDLAMLFRRPMFQYNGDYLLQAMSAIQLGGEASAVLKNFADLIRGLGAAKLDELPPNGSGLGWSYYSQELKERIGWLGKSSPPLIADRPTLEELRRERDVRRKRQAAATPVADTDALSKTFQHHFARCRNWLIELGLAKKGQGMVVLTGEGERLLRWMSVHTPSQPLRIPPTADMLQDAFQISRDEIARWWGVLVDESYWESGLYDVGSFGTYEPSQAEFLKVFDWAFDSVQIKGVSEASLSPLHQTIFMFFLFKQKPIAPALLETLIVNMFQEHADTYGLGRNRRGRPAFVFRKKRSLAR